MSKTIEIEITNKNIARETWFNLFVGMRFKATKSVHYKNHYDLTAEGLAELSNKLGKSFFKAVVHETFASPVGEKKEEVILNTFMIFPRAVKYVRAVRIFRATQDYHLYDRSGKNIIGTFFREGDLFEEIFDKPNTILKVEGVHREDREGSEYKLQYINQSNFLLEKFEELEEIPVKEGAIFRDRKEGLAKSYNRTRATLDKTMNKLNELRFLLDIEDEEEG